MTNTADLTKDDLSSLRAEVQHAYDAFKARGLKLDMTRGKPAPDQLDLSDRLMTLVSTGEINAANGDDTRNYGGGQGLPELRALFAPVLGAPVEQIAAADNSSLALMHDCVAWALSKGMPGGERPWSKEEAPAFLCPVPGYDRHFAICAEYGIRMIPVPMTETGPDMDNVEELVRDPSVKGMWLVPKYSNPGGEITSDATAQRLAAMQTGASDFRLFWDNAYVVHHLTETQAVARLVWVRQRVQEVAAQLADILEQGAIPTADVGPELPRRELLLQHHRSAAVERDGARISLERAATVMSYGEQADGIVTTARRSPDAAASDQVLVTFEKADYTLARTLEWETLGMRGTRSAGFAMKAKGDAAQVMPTPYADIHAQTMTPTAHLLWAASWAGSAAAAVERARLFTRKAARGVEGQTPPGAAHFTRAAASLRQLRTLVTASLARYEAIADDPAALTAMDFQTAITLLKVDASELAVSTVMSAMRACGLSGYRNDGDFTLGRHLRDILSAPIMINNDRILANVGTSALLTDTPRSLHD